MEATCQLSSIHAELQNPVLTSRSSISQNYRPASPPDMMLADPRLLLPCGALIDSHPQHQNRTAPGRSRPEGDGLCPIFQAARKRGSKFKHSVHVSASVVSGGKHCTLAQLTQYRARTAEKLGCNETEICWLLDAACSNMSSAMTSHLGTPGVIQCFSFQH